MDHIVDLTREIVSRIKNGDIPDTVFLTLKTPCPKCGGKVQETYRKFKCQKCDFAIWKVVSSREFAPEEIETLIAKRSVGPLTGFRSRVEIGRASCRERVRISVGGGACDGK